MTTKTEIPLETLQAELAALLDRRGEWTQRQRDTRAALESQIAQLQADMATMTRAEQRVANVQQQLASLTEWRDFLNASRQTILDELGGFRGHATSWGREARLEQERRQDLEQSLASIETGLQAFHGATCYSLKSLRLGALMVEAGYTENLNMEQLRVYGFLPWRGSLRECDAQMTSCANAV